MLKFPKIPYRPLSFALAPLIAMLGACERSVPEATPPAPFPCDRDGFLSVELVGGTRATLDWRADTLTCESMPRPDGEGARLRMSGPLSDAPDANIVAFILGIPALDKGATGKELATNVTFMEEGTGRFFGARDTNDCWTDIHRHEVVGTVDESQYRISGTVYCISPLAELNGASSISFTDLQFASRLSWEFPE